MSVGTFWTLIEERKDVILQRWVDAVLSAYPSDSAALFRTRKDPFANPLGHGVREGTRGVFRSLTDEMSPEDLRTHLDQIIRIRAVQDLSPSKAVSFVFSLRTIVREAIPEAEGDALHRKGLAELDRKIDDLALAAFELYTARREEVGQLRINEVKRRVEWLLGKMNRADEGTEDVLEDFAQQTSAYENVQREDL